MLFRSPSIGTFPVFLVYERLSKLCFFCSRLGHDHRDCPDRIRLQRLCLDPQYADREDMRGITDLRVGKWINDSTQVPKINTNTYPMTIQNHNGNNNNHPPGSPPQPQNINQNQNPNPATQNNSHFNALANYLHQTDPLHYPNNTTLSSNLDLNHGAELHSPIDIEQTENTTTTNPKIRMYANTHETRENSYSRKKRVMEATRVPPLDEI